MRTINRMAVTLGLVAACAWAGPIVTLELDPLDGFLAGAAGGSVGWGYTLSTDSDFVTIESFVFGDITPIGVFSMPGIPFTAASAGSPISTPWIPGFAGLQYDIASGAVLGASTLGPITVIYDVYSDELLIDQIGFAATVSATVRGDQVTAQVLVNAAVAGSAVPEPGTAALGVASLALLAGAAGICRRRSTLPHNCPICWDVDRKNDA